MSLPEEHINRGEAAGVLETRRQIRYELSQLSARNGHHDFEEMTRMLARNTVSRNILPATGPVSSGGDQGRDFETFRTQLSGQVLEIGEQIGIRNGDPVSFACTLQIEGIGSKIISDVARIMSEGTEVTHIVYYCEVDIPVRRRHELQDQAREAHGVHLEIFDGHGIAEQLSDWHLYWIAEEFLRLPARVLPSAPDRPDWYEDDLRRWRTSEHTPTTPGDLVDLSSCARYATFHEEAALDLPFWIEKLGELLREEVPTSVQQKACYEIAVAQLRGLLDLRPADHLVAQHIADAIESDEPSVLHDASVLLMYCIGARGRGLTNHNEQQIRDWNEQLQIRLIELLESAGQPGRRCYLLETLGWLRCQPDLVAARREGIEYKLEPDIPRLSLEEIEELASAGPQEPIEVPLMDLRGALDAWEDMISLLPEARLFPVDQIGEIIRYSAPLLVADERYDSVVTTIDERIAEVAGAAAAASNARDRAMIFYRDGRLLDALRDVHRARIKWFSGETTRGLLLASLMTSQIYRELELPLAAKYYAMSVGLLVADQDQDLTAPACFLAATNDYHQAAWFSTLAFSDLAFRAHLTFTVDPYNQEIHTSLPFAFFELTVIRAIARAANEAYAVYVDQVLDAMGLNSVLDSFLDSMDVPLWWESMGLEQLSERVVEQLGRPAFSDGGEIRTISWRALGVDWSVQFRNNYETTIVAERLAAISQIAIAELSLEDPVLIPTHVNFQIETGAEEDELTCEKSEDEVWHVRIPIAPARQTGEDFENITTSMLAAVITVIQSISLLSQNEFSNLLESAMSHGLLAKLLNGSVYDVMYRLLIPESVFDAAPRMTCPPLISNESSGQPAQATLLEPKRPGRYFSQEEQLQHIRNRYLRLRELLPLTISALREDPAFLDVVERLRAAGWKDWHILLAIFNIGYNYRLSVLPQPTTVEEARQVSEQVMNNPETEPAPIYLFTEEAMRHALQVSYFSTLKHWGLEPHEGPYDVEAIEKLLTERYFYWDDDVPHDDPFSGPTL